MKCKICNSKELNKLDCEKSYYHCDNCDLIFIDEEDIIDCAEEKERYAQHDNNHQNSGYVEMFKRFINQFLEPHVDMDKLETVLDFGCGPGPVLADLLKERGLKVDIYDPFFYPEKVFEGNEYDLITSTEVFEHLKNPLKEIELLLEHLKDGGYLALMTLYHPGLEKFKDWWYKRDPTHITFYNHNTFREMEEIFPLEVLFTDKNKYCLFKKRMKEKDIISIEKPGNHFTYSIASIDRKKY